MPEPVPLRVRWAERMETDAFTRHKIYVQSECDYWVPAYYFVPHEIRAPAPGLVCLHGHSGVYPYIREWDAGQEAKMRQSAVDYAPSFAERGYVTIAPIQRGWNETAENVPEGETGCYRMVLSGLLAGVTPVGLRCWDASRILDFLASQEAVDPRRIGAAGLSGGGTVSLFWSAIEPRVRLTMIAGHFGTFRDSVFAIRHCICNCIPHIMEWGDMREVAALIAPRPLLIINGKNDPIFPIRKARQVYRGLRKVYELLDAAGNLDNDFFDGSHAWSNRKAPAFVARHFPLPTV